METKEKALEFVHQNGVGNNIKCFFTTYRDIEGEKEHMSIVNQYKYNKGLVKIYVQVFDLKEHEKNLVGYRDQTCELFIKDINNSQLFVILFCKFLNIKNRFIYVRAFGLRYKDNEEREINYKIKL